MDRPYRPDRDRDRDRDLYRDRDNYRNNYRDRERNRGDRDFNHQPRRPSRFSDGPPPSDDRRSPRGGFSAGGGPPYRPPPGNRHSPRGGFSGPPPQIAPPDNRRSPRGGGGGFSADGPPPHLPPPDHRRTPPRGGYGGPPHLPPPDHRRSPPRGGFSGPPPHLPPPDHRRTPPRGGFSGPPHPHPPPLDHHRRSPPRGGGGFPIDGPFHPPPPDNRRSSPPRGGGWQPSGPPHPPMFENRRSPGRGRGFSASGLPHPPPIEHRNSPRGGGGFFEGGPPPQLPPIENRRSPGRGFPAGGGRGFESGSPPRQPPPVAERRVCGEYRPVPGGHPEELWPMRGAVGVGGPGNDVGGGFGTDFPPQRLQLQPPPINHPPPPQLSGQKRGFPGNGGSSPENYDGRSFVKLFVGSVPRTATEEEVRPLFEEQGKVLEVALIKDKRTGQQQGCCFIKYATSEDADRAIKALHNQYTLPGGVGPIQVRYADGERERLGNVEYKLFVGSLNKYATEKEVEEIFIPYGRTEDVYLMRDERKQSRGCGFVKYYNKESAMAAVNALNGIFTMRGCDQPLTVRFADPKRPRAGEPRTGPALGGPGFGPPPSPGIRPPSGPNAPDITGGQGPPNTWQPFSPQNMGQSPNAGIHGFGNQLPPRSGEASFTSIPGGHIGAQSGAREGSFGGAVSASCASPQNYNQSFPQVPPGGQQISPLQKPIQSQQFPPALQSHQGPGSYSQVPTSQPSMRPPSQPQSGNPAPYGQAFQSQQFQSMPGQLPPQFQAQQSEISVTAKPQPKNSPSLTNSQLATPAPQQPLPFEQSPSQLAQMLSQQTQTLQASFQSSQQTFSQLQQQLQMMQPSTQNQPLQQSFQPPKQQSFQPPKQQSFQPPKQQSHWGGVLPTTTASAPHAGPTLDAQPSTSLAPFGAAVAAKTAPLKCDWTEHTAPGGHKYYYNSVTGESKWEKPEELTLYDQQQQTSVVQPALQQPLPQPQTQPQTHSQSLAPANSGNGPARFQQGFPPAQDWAWNNSRGN